MGDLSRLSNVKNRLGRIIGQVAYDAEFDWWESRSFKMEEKSRGLSGHSGIDSKEEAIRDVQELERAY